MSDREEREEHIKRLEAALACEEKQFSGKCSKQTCDDNCALLYEQGNWGEWKETLRYAIDSLKTDLKYDLLYEETSGQADKPIPKNDLGVDAVSRADARSLICKIDIKHHLSDMSRKAFKDLYNGIDELPSVTPQLSSGLENGSPIIDWNNCHTSEQLDSIATPKNNLGVDYISKQEVVGLMMHIWGKNHSGDDAMQECIDAIRDMSSVTPQEPRCKECKWWKDSDGKYRRGCRAESQCPINRKEVYEGNGYCFLYEPQESEA